jgi:DNA polymerase III subunit epsilon
MIEQAMKAEGHRTLNNRWLDLEPVAAVLHPGLGARALDDWLGRFGIACAVRHQAAADTLATAELLLRLWPAARRQRCASFAGLSALARQQRWLYRSRKAAKRSASRSG